MNRAGVFLVVVVLLLAGGWLLRRPRGAVRGAPVDVAIEPLQEPVDPPEVADVERRGHHFSLEKFFRYEIAGEVVSASEYDLTWTNDFFDVDVGLVWGPRLSELKERYSFFQMGRWLFWRSKGPVSGEERDYITAHMGNQHLIPAEGHANVARAIKWIRGGDHVHLRGYLVRIRDENGHQVAVSSTSRHDTGDGACEIVWVDEVQIGTSVYR
jgi:hypothetical protein